MAGFTEAAACLQFLQQHLEERWKSVSISDCLKTDAV
jgi:hypothetical protein